MEVTTSERYASGGELGDLPAQNLIKAFDITVDRLGDDPAIRTQDDSYSISWNELRERVHRIAGGLAKLGVTKGDTVALMLNNRPEFIPCDLAAVALGGIPFSIYQTSSPEQISYVCSDSECKVAIVETMFLEQFEKAREDLPDIEHVIVVDGDGGTHTLAGVEEMDPGYDPAPVVDELQPDDMLTLIYTSGTTGPPKGVQLTHRNLMGLTSGVEEIVDFPERGAKVISWLPAAHIAERGAHYYLPVIRGVGVTICPDPRKIGESLAAVRPTWFFAVPRIFEKIKSGIEAKLGSLPDGQREASQQGVAAAIKKVRLEQAGEEVPEELAAGVAQAEEALFAPLREQLGFDELVACNVGAAPTPVEVLEFFHAIGIPIGELWGMSETCGVATCNPPEKVKIGTVGPPVPGVEIKLAEDGEVLVKAPSVMPGYRNLPEKNAETFDSDGWLLTGDIGELDSDGYLKITGRKKDIIITAGGKNITPANLEAEMKQSRWISQCVVVGDRRPYLIALVTLDPEEIAKLAEEKGWPNDPAAIAEQPEMRELISGHMDEINKKFAQVEQIKKFEILPADLSQEGGELTPTLKVKRNVVSEKYEPQIEALYG